MAAWMRPLVTAEISASKSTRWERLSSTAITNRDRFEGYRSALSSARIEADDSLHIAGDNSIASGRSAARKILEHPKRPTAIFCANDEMAIGAIVACRELGLGVPDEVSIVGFDDIEMAAYYHPPLTTVRQPRKDIGKKAMSELLAQLDGSRKRLGRRIVLEHSLIVRQSTSARPN